MNILASAATSTLDEDNLIRNTKNVIALFKHWNLKNEQESNLLGGISPAQLNKLKKGAAHISGRDAIERVGNLLGIHKSLRILFPHNREVVYKWIRSRNKKLDNLTPLDVMLEHGYIGIAQIRLFVDNMRGI